MRNWLKTFLGMKPVIPAQINESARNDAAREELNRLRREELSVGAQLRQGEPVNSFPGLASGAVAKDNSPARSNQARGQAQSVQSSGAYGDDDFTTSMVVGAATGSAFAGYAVGSSLAGAIAGSSIHQSLLPTFDSCGESCSSTGTASSGCDI